MDFESILIQANTSNYTLGRYGNLLELIVIHYTGTMASALDNGANWRDNHPGTSAHFIIDRDGTIVQSVLLKDMCHAAGNIDVNRRSASIEFVSDGRDFTQAQIESGAKVVQYIMRTYGLTKECVIRHHDVVRYARYGYIADPWKCCPAPYVNGDDNSKWYQLRDLLTGEITPTHTTPTERSSSQKIVVDGWIGLDSVSAWQRVMGCKYIDGIISRQWCGSKRRHYAITTVEYGVGGSLLVKAIQRKVGVTVDGYMGVNTIKAWQKFVGVDADGWFGNDTARATQRWINSQL